MTTLTQICAQHHPHQVIERQFARVYFTRAELVEDIEADAQNYLSEALMDDDRYLKACARASYGEAKSIRRAIVERIADNMWERCGAGQDDADKANAADKADSERDQRIENELC
jgi:hypothetical protein